MDLVITVTFFRPTPMKYYELTPIIINDIRQVATYHTRGANTRERTNSEQEVLICSLEGVGIPV